MNNITIPAYLSVLDVDTELDFEVEYDRSELGVSVCSVLVNGVEVVLDNLTILQIESELETFMDDYNYD